MRREAERDCGPDDPRWSALTLGRLSEEEVAALRAEAEQSEDGRALYELYRPLDLEEKERIFAAVAARVRAHKRARRQRALLAVALLIIAGVVLALVCGALRVG
jgi:hypothetical protein